MSDPQFSDPQKQADESRPGTEAFRPGPDSYRPNESYRNGDSYRPSDSYKNQNLATSRVKPFISTEQTNDVMFSQLSEMMLQMKKVVKPFREFFEKYLLPEENHMRQIENERPQQQQQAKYTPPQSSQQNARQYKYAQPNDDYPYKEEEKFEQLESTRQQGYSQATVTPPKKHGFGKKIVQKDRDPNKPRTPLTPYFLFFQQTRQILRKKYPEVSLAQIGSMGGKIWRQLSEEERQRYKDRYEQQRIEYKAKMREYNATGGILQSRMMDAGQDLETVDYF